MREIKFRAWLIDELKMCIVNNITYGKRYSQQYIQWIDTFHHKRVEFPNFKLMQFTGLKDKNGKDIYEGDILLCEKAKSRMPSRGTLRKKDPKQISGYLLVEWRDAGFHFDFTRPIDEHKESHEEKNYTYAYFQFSIWDGQQEQPHVEIVGNIYENPEMIPNE